MTRRTRSARGCRAQRGLNPKGPQCIRCFCAFACFFTASYMALPGRGTSDHSTCSLDASHLHRAASSHNAPMALRLAVEFWLKRLMTIRDFQCPPAQPIPNSSLADLNLCLTSGDLYARVALAERPEHLQSFCLCADFATQVISAYTIHTSVSFFFFSSFSLSLFRRLLATRKPGSSAPGSPHGLEKLGTRNPESTSIGAFNLSSTLRRAVKPRSTACHAAPVCMYNTCGLGQRQLYNSVCGEVAQLH